MIVTLSVDGSERVADVDAGCSLATLLRDVLGVTAVKNGCDQGECGSCTVLLDGELACACLVPAFQADRADVRTARSFANGGPGTVQDAFLDAGAVQCGYCTPGLVVAVSDLLARDPHPSDHAVREALAGNICRCTGYRKILDAVRLAEERLA
ncbi:MAG: (2Fe-2S)-binding protein [Gaiellaceae bacterium]